MPWIFLRLDAGSAWFWANLVRMSWRQGKLAEAREAAEKMPEPGRSKFLLPLHGASRLWATTFFRDE
jgi:hypothetical protein